MKATTPTRKNTRARSARRAHRQRRRREFVELTAETVTDGMIESMLHYARGHGDPDTAVMCCRALRPQVTITMPWEAAARLAARTGCARQINERARGWLDGGYSEYRLYASLVGLGSRARRKAQRRRPRVARHTDHPLCWECNSAIRPDEERRIVELRGRGPVSVHLQCVNAIDDAELDECAPRVGARVATAEDTIDAPDDDP
ncbi:MAG TPA: hypothetical protein VGM90_28155 [Kofleriaceae bacterium]|jgi:hypothetical protein